MHHIQFEFICSQPVPLYGHLCQEYIARHVFNISASQFTGEEHNTHYVIEATGSQAELETLAEDIAEHFLLSVWLVDSKMQLVKERQYPTSSLGKDVHLPVAPLVFCHHCQPKFGDNQNPQFGDINLACDHCGGQNKLPTAHDALSEQDIFAFAQLLLEKQPLHLVDDNLTLSLTAIGDAGKRPSIIVCNPNTLNDFFQLNDKQVQALSSHEKPCLNINTNEAGAASLQASMVDVQFASNRLLVVLCEKLRQKGVNWIYSQFTPSANTQLPPLKLALIDEQWVAKQLVQAGQTELKLSALHDEACAQIGNLAYTATSHKKHISWQISQQEQQQISPATHAAECALYAGLQSKDVNGKSTKPKYATVLFFSRYQASQIVMVDQDSKAELFLEMPEMPSVGSEIINQLNQSPEKGLVEKFKAAHPDSYNALMNLAITTHANSVTSFMVAAACVVGIKLPTGSAKSVTQQLADNFVSDAMSYRGSNAPRIDFPLILQGAQRSINWCKTLGSLMSFRLAGEDDTTKLAFAFHDSLADYLSNWVEHIDNNTGVHNLVLAGSEFDNPVLAKRIRLRVGKNIPIVINKQLDLEGANLAIGGLFLTQRRR
ncbi:NiFe hydrogenase [Shewanella intestini]|uniref:NiFe hydrogenase n=1 Tax=Shewanella intestini TaxID=2017544 RepID=A0ABS5I2C9_9GAMM|nr:MULTISPECIES: NiFe hydrogenase [Shewanella]MBR9728031.1 NiFe hydrogenase [Shewanella intestini]MRG36418.1 NiFe hydrogenase [Shewanella sp. XMDDZSB0408]